MATRSPLSEKEVADTMKRWQEAFEAGSDKLFEFFDPDVSLFTLSSPTRVDGREIYRRGIEGRVLGKRWKSQILSPEVRLIGPEGAVMTFHNRINRDGISANFRGAVVFARDATGDLKCVHVHISPLRQPMDPWDPWGNIPGRE